MVVNDAGGTGAKARVKGIGVAGKTGSAQATDRGKDDMIAWFCCFAPYDKPRYAICAMVQGGHHGGGVAAPIAQHILEQVIAMEQGNLNVELTKLTPASNPNPFQKIEALTDYKDAKNFVINPEKNEEEEGADSHGATNSKVQMGGNGAAPDIREGADAAGKVQGRGKPTPRPVDKPNFFQRFFLGAKPSTATTPRPSGPPSHGTH
jgi:penicillin-binding protein 2